MGSTLTGKRQGWDYIRRINSFSVSYLTDAQRPVPRIWIRSTEVRRGTSLREWEHNNNSVSLSLELKVSTPPVNRIIIYSNSGSVIGWINFHTFTCTGNMAMFWEPDPLSLNEQLFSLTLLHSEDPKLYGVLVILSAIGLREKQHILSFKS